MKKEKILYSIVGISILIFAIGSLLSQYVEYQQFRLSQEKAIRDCIEKDISTDATGFVAANIAHKCKDNFSR
ncbi:MAG: hypothetical protein UX81_C0025G0012 [Parcubacteria group bacterium GW2011_GWA2_47_12]|nr:MAG: hypothetical protein UX81_C0025G0012 [Parcubacteria group bacterium GW2011_GWA2_47_12]